MNSDKKVGVLTGGGTLGAAAAMLMGGFYQNGRPGGRVPYSPRASTDAQMRVMAKAGLKQQRKNEKRKRDFERHAK